MSRKVEPMPPVDVTDDSRMKRAIAVMIETMARVRAEGSVKIELPKTLGDLLPNMVYAPPPDDSSDKPAK